jgi:hypothetical protein
MDVTKWGRYDHQTMFGISYLYPSSCSADDVFFAVSAQYCSARLRYVKEKKADADFYVP